MFADSRRRDHARLRAQLGSLLEDPAVQSEVRACLDKGLPWAPDTYRRLGAARLLAPHWPVEYGGMGGKMSDSAVVAEQMVLAGVPDTGRVNTIDNAGTTILEAGSIQQKERYLPAMARGELLFSVLYSEPGCGSDLGDLRATAHPTSDGWIINGTKIWNARSDLADFGICALRTPAETVAGGDRFASVTLFVVPLDGEGVSIEQVPGIIGETFTRVDFHDVTVAHDALVGRVGGGWALIVHALGIERTGITLYARARRWLDALMKDGPPGADSGWAAHVNAEAECARSLCYHVAALLDADRATQADLAGAKWLGTVCAQEAARMWWRFQPSGADPAYVMREAPGLSLAAGTSEMMLTTVAASLADRERTLPPHTPQPPDWLTDFRETFRAACEAAMASDDPAGALRAAVPGPRWLRPLAPAELGGLGLSVAEARTFAEEAGLAGLPPAVAGEIQPVDETVTALILTAAYLLGTAHRALRAAVDRAGTRVQFGRPLIRNQAISFPLAGDTVRLDALAVRLAELARAADAGADVEADVTELFVKLADTCVRACQHCIQVCGAYGLTSEAAVSGCYASTLDAVRRIGLPGRQPRPERRGPRHVPAPTADARQAAARRWQPEWAGTAVHDDSASSIHELFERAAAAHPDCIAVKEGDVVITYEQLNGRAGQLARLLTGRGVRPGHIVAVCLERSIDLIVAVLAVLKAGAVYLPIDPEYPPARIQYMLADSGTRFICTRAWMREWLPDDVPAVNVDELEFDGPGNTPEAGIGPHDLGYLMYTSGSTGAPKGVEIAHQGAVNRLLLDMRTLGLRPGDICLAQISISFDFSVIELFGALASGATLLLAKPGGQRDPAYLMDLIIRERVTVISLVPSQLDLLLDQEPGFDRCPELRYVFSGGEELTSSVCARFFASSGASLYNFYGPTEVTIDAAFWHCTVDSVGDSVPIGRPVDNCRCYVLDENAMPVPAGAVGELYVGGVGVARGYRGKTALTAQCFLPDPFHASGGRMYRTGDLVRLRDDGALEFIGRRDEQVKVHGHRVEPGEVEGAMLRHPAVNHAVVYMVKSSPSSARLEATVVARDAVELEVARLRAWLLDHLPAYLVPARINLAPELPRTASGKVDRSALSRQFATSPASEPLDAGTVQSAVCRLAARVLGVSDADVDPRRDFFEMGGGSIDAARLVHLVKRELGERVDLGDFLADPTMTALAQLAGQSRGDG